MKRITAVLVLAASIFGMISGVVFVDVANAMSPEQLARHARIERHKSQTGYYDDYPRYHRPYRPIVRDGYRHGRHSISKNTFGWFLGGILLGVILNNSQQAEATVKETRETQQELPVIVVNPQKTIIYNPRTIYVINEVPYYCTGEILGEFV
jgi:hypothetical protein